MADFTPTQGQYLAFIRAYTDLHGYPPAESEIAGALCVSAPSVSQMMKTLERRGLIVRQPGQPRSAKVLVPDEQLPPWKSRKPSRSPRRVARRTIRLAASLEPGQGNLYVLSVYLSGGPVSKRIASRQISRVIEIRGDQTLEELHHAIFQAYDRFDEHLYEFQFGKRPFDPEGPNYGTPDFASTRNTVRDASTTKLDDLGLKPDRVFGYWFDFGDDWYHQIRVERIEQAIPTVRYPRVVKRVGKSPPQYRGG
jgi:hypothetical protein